MSKDVSDIEDLGGKHPASYHNLTEEEVLAVRTNLLRWYRANRRKLPWRGDPPPYTGSTSKNPQTKKSKALPSPGNGILGFFGPAKPKKETVTNVNQVQSQKCRRNSKDEPKAKRPKTCKQQMDSPAADWSCKRCTFLNQWTRRSCSMCGSRQTLDASKHIPISPATTEFNEEWWISNRAYGSFLLSNIHHCFSLDRY